MAPFDRLWQAFEQARREPPRDLAGALCALPDVGFLPSPWVTWTLIGLVRHRRRQHWVAEIVSTRLGGQPNAIARRGAFGHPAETARHGLVPGLTEWEYEFHGIGCRLTHRGTGETIDVDFFGPTGEYVDVFFYLLYLRSLRSPEAPEVRLIALHPSIEPVRLAVGELLEAGMLTPLKGRAHHPFRIAERVLDHEDAIDAYCSAYGRPDRRVWLAALAGDWLAAREAALNVHDEHLINLTAGRAAQCRALHLRDLLVEQGDEDRRSNTLSVLDDLDADTLGEQLDRAIQGPIGGVNARAVQIIRRRNDPAWCPALYQLFQRVDPVGELPQPYLWADCLEYLLKHGHRALEMRGSLMRADGIAAGEAALLALEYDLGSALPLFRRALRSPIPISRIVSAATLALIDQPWSRRELLQVLEESGDQDATADCRAALMESHDATARKTVLAWEEDNPHEPEPGPGIMLGEIMLRNRPWWVRREMEKRHDRVMRVRDRDPG